MSGDGRTAFDGRLEVRELSLPQIRGLYAARLTEDFPPNELKPLAMIERALSLGQYICYGAFSGEAILAYAFFVRLDRLALVDYYAVLREVRDRGVGGWFLGALMDGPLKGMDCVLLEVEDPDCATSDDERAMRLRRLQFYLRNGLIDTGVGATVYGVPYRILSLPVGRSFASRQVRQTYAALYRAMLPKKLFDTWVRL